MTSVKTTVNSKDYYTYSVCRGTFDATYLANEVKRISQMPGFKKNMNAIANLIFCKYDTGKLVTQLKQYSEAIIPFVHKKGEHYKLAVVLPSVQAMADFSPYIAFSETLKMPFELRLFLDFSEVAKWFKFSKDAIERLQNIIERYR